MRARDAMSRDVQTVSPEATVGEAALLMSSSGHGALPVIDEDGKLLGLVTKTPLVRRLLPTYLEQVGDLYRSGEFKPFQDNVEKVALLPVTDVMDRKPLTATEDTPLAEVAAMMVMHNARQVLIVEGERLVGVVGMQDIVDMIAWPEPNKSADT
ncbi:MAG: CBS domain-containing protein [Armatimonadetes bacterium]|nr:CBS domain-containing protein [Armatimonadota bacterium]